MSILMSGVWYGCMFVTSTALAISDHTAVAGYIQGASRSHLRVGRGAECGHGIRRSACCGNTNMAPATAVAIKGMFLKLHSFSTLILLRSRRRFFHGGGPVADGFRREAIGVAVAGTAEKLDFRGDAVTLGRTSGINLRASRA